MFLGDNPFHLLGASPFDDRDRLAGLTDELSLRADGGEVAWAELTHPGRRLSAELAWLPGLQPEDYGRLFAQLAGPALPDPKSIDELPPLAGCNFAAELVIRRPELPGRFLLTWALVKLPRVYEKIRVGELLAAINAARRVSGFPEVSSQNLAGELGRREEALVAAVCEVLDRRMTAEVISLMTAMAENSGQGLPPVLSLRILDIYETEALAFFQEEIEALESLCQALVRMAFFKKMTRPTRVLLARLRWLTAAWKYVSRPLVLAARRQGFAHEPTEDLTCRLLNLSSNFNNNYDNPVLGNYLNNLLLKIFPASDVSSLARQNRAVFAAQLGFLESRAGRFNRGPVSAIIKKARSVKGFAGLSSLALSCRQMKEELRKLEIYLQGQAGRRRGRGALAGSGAKPTGRSRVVPAPAAKGFCSSLLFVCFWPLL